MRQGGGTSGTRLRETAKLISGIIVAQDTGSEVAPLAPDSNIKQIYNILENTFGRIDLRSEIIPFDFTNYYEEELGTDLQRQWVSFEKLIAPEDLASIKLSTVQIENSLKRPSGTRKVNLDPGYITLHNLVLASTKNYSHRIYLGNNIYAELTLIYQNHSFHPLDWTYPDYRENIKFFEEVRAKFCRFQTASRQRR